VVHTIAPFIVERSLEQIKIDFCYQNLGGNFVSVGGSYDYAALGCTHHCPGDVGILKYVPGMQVVVPGHPDEFDTLFQNSYANGKATYFRLSERSNTSSCSVEFGKASVVRKGTEATVVAVGPLLDDVLTACSDLDVTVLYYSTLEPFDGQTLAENCPSRKFLLCEPYYSGALDHDVISSVGGSRICIRHVGVPHVFLTSYGSARDQDREIGMTSDNIRAELEILLNE
jgi:transketolase